MTTALFTQEDLDQINGKIKPKNIKTFWLFSLCSLCLCFLLPFVPGKNSRVSPYVEGIYWNAFLFYLTVSAAIMFLIYSRFIMSINQDLRDGEKLVAKLPLKIKKELLLDAKFQLIFDKGRLLHTPVITLPNSEINNWQQGELVELNLLYKSGEILHYKKVSE